MKAEQLVDKLIDFSSFLTRVLKVKPERFRGGKKKVAYHSPCHLCRGMGVVQEPRDLLATAGLEYLPGPGRRHLLRHGRHLIPWISRSSRRRC